MTDILNRLDEIWALLASVHAEVDAGLLGLPSRTAVPGLHDFEGSPRGPDTPPNLFAPTCCGEVVRMVFRARPKLGATADSGIADYELYLTEVGSILRRVSTELGRDRFPLNPSTFRAVFTVPRIYRDNDDPESWEHELEYVDRALKLAGLYGGSFLPAGSSNHADYRRGRYAIVETGLWLPMAVNRAFDLLSPESSTKAQHALRGAIRRHARGAAMRLYTEALVSNDVAEDFAEKVVEQSEAEGKAYPPEIRPLSPGEWVTVVWGAQTFWETAEWQALREEVDSTWTRELRHRQQLKMTSMLSNGAFNVSARSRPRRRVF